MGADEASDASDEPGLGGGLELGLDLGVGWHFRDRGVRFGRGLWGGWLAGAACPLSPGPSPARGEGSEEGAVGLGSGRGGVAFCSLPNGLLMNDY